MMKMSLSVSFRVFSFVFTIALSTITQVCHLKMFSGKSDSITSGCWLTIFSPHWSVAKYSRKFFRTSKRANRLRMNHRSWNFTTPKTMLTCRSSFRRRRTGSVIRWFVLVIAWMITLTHCCQSLATKITATVRTVLEDLCPRKKIGESTGVDSLTSTTDQMESLWMMMAMSKDRVKNLHNLS